MAELDKFIKSIPGPEKVKVNVDLHDLTYAFQGDYLSNKDLNTNKESGAAKSKGSGSEKGASSGPAGAIDSGGGE